MTSVRANLGVGAVLLEVVLSLTLFVSAAAIVGAGLSASTRSAMQVKVEAQLADLAETLMSEVQMGLVELVDQGPTPYEAPQEDWTWQVTCQSVEQVEGLSRVEVAVAHTPTGRQYRLSQLVPTPDDSQAAPAAEGGP